MEGGGGGMVNFFDSLEIVPSNITSNIYLFWLFQKKVEVDNLSEKLISIAGLSKTL